MFTHYDWNLALVATAGAILLGGQFFGAVGAVLGAAVGLLLGGMTKRRV